MPDKDDDVVNVDLEPEDALRILLDTDLRKDAKDDLRDSSTPLRASDEQKDSSAIEPSHLPSTT